MIVVDFDEIDHGRKNSIVRKYVPKSVYNDEFMKSLELGRWTERFGILNLQLIDNILSGNKFRFNKGYDMQVFDRVKDRIIEKLLDQLFDKVDLQKSTNVFAFASAFIWRWGYKYIMDAAKKGLNPESKLTYYDRILKSHNTVSFVSAF